jgi:3-methyladenine DNA glycosylase AlkD
VISLASTPETVSTRCDTHDSRDIRVRNRHRVVIDVIRGPITARACQLTHTSTHRATRTLRAVAVNRKLQTAIRAALADAADPAKAAPMQAYMKSVMPYYGVSSVPLRAICRDVLPRFVLRDEAAWLDTCRAIWDDARCREERYVAVELTGLRAYRAYQTPAAMALYEHFIVDGAWWDHVDAVAIHRVGPLLREFPDEIEPIMRAWSTDQNMWRRRTSIICQVGSKADTDLGLLYDCIEPNMADTEFFIRKAIGWALRQYAWLNPMEVERYVRAHEDRLSGLSKREALKNIAKASAKLRT